MGSTASNSSSRIQGKFNIALSDSTGNLYWTPTMCLAWQSFAKEIIKQPIKIKSDDSGLLKLAENFNKSDFSKHDIKDQYYYIKAGLGLNTVKAINKEVRIKFPNITCPPLQEKMPQSSYAIYGYLCKALQFRSPLSVCPDPADFGEIKQQKYLYPSTKNEKQMLLSHNYKSQTEFLIQVQARNQSEQIFFLKFQHQNPTILDVITAFQKSFTKNPKNLEEKDSFLMPVIDLQITHALQQLSGVHLNNQISGINYLGQIYEVMKLFISEKDMVPATQPMIKQPSKVYHLNGPFWIILKQKECQPYLITFIKNPRQIPTTE